jgi:hypothetical protein
MTTKKPWPEGTGAKSGAVRLVTCLNFGACRNVMVMLPKATIRLKFEEGMKLTKMANPHLG